MFASNPFKAFSCKATALVMLLCFSAISQAALKADKPTVLITGANRGIGLEFVTQYSAMGWNVIATSRKPEKSTELNALAANNPQIIVEQLDVTDHPRIESLGEKYEDQTIDVLINNAAITPKYKSAYRKLNGVDFDMALKSLEVNAIAPLKISQVFMPHVQSSKQKKIIFISSKGGSFAESPKAPMMYSYRASKAALNMYIHTMHYQTKKTGVVVTALSPGLVNTVDESAGGLKMPNAISPTESVGKLISIIDSLSSADNGKFLSHKDRSVIPW